MKKFTFESTFEEVDIAGEIYKVDFSDEKLEEYQRLFSTFEADMDELKKLDPMKMSADQNIAAMEKQRIFIKNTIDGILGFGAFDTLYKKAGSLLNMAKLLAFIGEVLHERMEHFKPNKKMKYVKKGRAV